MKPIFVSMVFGGLMLALAPPAVAQEDGWTFGLGVGVQSVAVPLVEVAGIVGAFAPRLYMPLELGDILIVEPGFGSFHFESEGTRDRERVTVAAYRYEAGFLFPWPAGPDGRVYLGPRLGILRVFEEREDRSFDSKTERTDLVVAAVVGGEFFLLDRLSLGGELGIERVTRGKTRRIPWGVPLDQETMTLQRTTTEIRLRWYLR